MRIRNGYIERKAAGGSWRNWWLVGARPLLSMKIYLPAELVGKRIRFRMEEVGEHTEFIPVNRVESLISNTVFKYQEALEKGEKVTPYRLAEWLGETRYLQ